jgi:tRNA 2-thiouridine synthesizing protein A
MEADQHIDLRGLSCPLNYAKTKLKLGAMERGQILEVLIEDGEPMVTVPRSLKEDGHRILKIEQIADCFKVLVRKA